MNDDALTGVVVVPAVVTVWWACSSPCLEVLMKQVHIDLTPCELGQEV